MKVLILDDSLTAIELLKSQIKALSSSEVEIKTYNDTEAFINDFEADDSPTIFIDFNMPKMNGLEVLQAINYSGPKILLTAFASNSLSSEIENMENLTLIRKPINLQKLKDILKID